jgi:hypothetical protein
VVALALSATLASRCGKEAPSRARLARVAAESRARLASSLSFQSPADGLLTEAQIDRYVKVRRAAKGRSDEDASRAVGVDLDEFAWVRSRIFESLLEADRRRVRTAADEVFGRTIASLRETRKSARDAATVRSLDEQIAGLERERAGLRKPEPVSAAVAANARRVAVRRAEIDGLP